MPSEAAIAKLLSAIGERDINVRPLELALQAIHLRWMFKRQQSFLLLAETEQRAKLLMGMVYDLHEALPWYAQPATLRGALWFENHDMRSVIEVDWIREPDKGNRRTAILLDVDAETAKQHKLLPCTRDATKCRIISDAESPNWGFAEWDILQIDGRDE